MPERTLTRQQAFDAYQLLNSLDPDDCSEAGVLESVIWNRKALEPHATTYEQRYQALTGPAAATEDGDVVEVEEGEDAHPLERQLGVRLDLEGQEYAELDRRLGEMQSEDVEVTLATAPVSALQQVDSDLDRWHFMLDVDV